MKKAACSRLLNCWPRKPWDGIVWYVEQKNKERNGATPLRTIKKQLLNSAFVGCEEFCRSYNQPHSIIANYRFIDWLRLVYCRQFLTSVEHSYHGEEGVEHKPITFCRKVQGSSSLLPPPGFVSRWPWVQMLGHAWVANNFVFSLNHLFQLFTINTTESKLKVSYYALTLW